jgi:hypothetical protein
MKFNIFFNGYIVNIFLKYIELGVFSCEQAY